MKRPLNVLIACEESQAECSAFRALGHYAYSCDIQRCRPSGRADWHICSDVTPLLAGSTSFTTQSGDAVVLPQWDLIIAHPPCTYLCKVSSVQMHTNPDTWCFTSKGWLYLNGSRYRSMLLARDFFFACLNAVAPHVAVENPLPMAISQLPCSTTYVDPSWFGVKYTKKTLYWLKNLPPILAETEYPNPRTYTHSSRGKYRSRTFPALAAALANQWSHYILDESTVH